MHDRGQDGGARIKELKRRWPRVFIYVEKDNTLTVRGSVQEEVDACFFLALFFKVFVLGHLLSVHRKRQLGCAMISRLSPLRGVLVMGAPRRS